MYVTSVKIAQFHDHFDKRMTTSYLEVFKL